MKVYITATVALFFLTQYGDNAEAAPGINSLALSRSAAMKSVRRAPSSMSQRDIFAAPPMEEFYDNGYDELDNENEVQLCSAAAASLPASNPVLKNIVRGAFLRVASDLTGGTALENIKCRVTATCENPIKATRDLVTGGNGFLNLWSGTPSRTVEGALLGAVFLVASSATKKQVIAMGASKNAAALAGGIVGGVVQAVIMTPAGMIFTSLNVNKGKPGFENDNAVTITKRIISEKGIQGMFVGGGPMAVRQASNWASRSFFTELCRTNLNLSQYGLLGEIAAGTIGGIGSCWNTPIETVRVIMQRDVSAGLPPKTFNQYIASEMEEGGIPMLFRGITPRSVQAIWQTIFMVVVPNLLGI